MLARHQVPMMDVGTITSHPRLIRGGTTTRTNVVGQEWRFYTQDSADGGAIFLDRRGNWKVRRIHAIRAGEKFHTTVVGRIADEAAVPLSGLTAHPYAALAWDKASDAREHTAHIEVDKTGDGHSLTLFVWLDGTVRVRDAKTGPELADWAAEIVSRLIR